MRVLHPSFTVFTASIGPELYADFYRHRAASFEGRYLISAGLVADGVLARPTSDT